MRTLHPVWDESLALEVASAEDVLDVTVYDWDAVGSNDRLGTLSLPLAHLFAAALDPAAAAAAAVDGEVLRATVRRWWALKAADGPGGTGQVELQLVYEADVDAARGAAVDVLLHYVCAAVAARDGDELEERLMEAREAEVADPAPAAGPKLVAGPALVAGRAAARRARGSDWLDDQAAERAAGLFCRRLALMPPRAH